MLARKLFLFFLFYIFAGGNIYGEDIAPHIDKRFSDWAVYSYRTGRSFVSYALSVPKFSQPSNVDHGDVYFLVSRRPGKDCHSKDMLEVQFLSGYKLKEHSEVILNITSGGKEGGPYYLFTDGKCAWLKSRSDEQQVVAMMARGSSLRLRAISQRGTRTSYNFSLIGVSRALSYIRSCQ